MSASVSAVAKAVDLAREARKNFGELVNKARVAKRLKQDYLAEKLGLSQGYISQIERGEGTVPDPAVIKGLSKILEIEEREMRLILAPAAIDQVRADFRELIEIRDPEAPNTTPMRSGSREDGRFPKLGLAACGRLLPAIENDKMPHGERRTTEPWRAALDEARDPKHPDRIRPFYVVEAEGDSMHPIILDGDELLIDPNPAHLLPSAKPAQIALAIFRGEATVKRYRVHGPTMVLTPENPAFEVQEIDMAEFEESGGIARRVAMARSTRKFR